MCSARLRIEAEQAKASDVFEGNAHDLLVATYRGRYRPTPIQLRAAAIAIAYESQNSVTAFLADTDDFARLERAIARSGKEPKLIEVKLTSNDRSLFSIVSI